jgi:hypothetical protein
MQALREQREALKFWAVWELDCRVSPQRRRKIGPLQERHTVILVEKPLSERYKKDHGYLVAFWVYLDGFEAYAYARDAHAEVRGLCHFAAPAYAPEEERFLLACASAHHLYPGSVERSLPRTLEIEQEKGEWAVDGKLWVRVPSSSEGWVVHPYVQRQKRWQVTLGGKSCRVVCYIYTMDALWLGGLCWQERIENWCFMPAGEEAIEVYSRPGKMQVEREGA